MFSLAMSSLLKTHLPTLRQLKRRTESERKRFLKSCPRNIIDCCCEIARNIIKRNVPLAPRQLKSLRRHGNKLRDLSKLKTPLARKRKILQTGGFLPLLIGPLLAIASNLLGGRSNG